MPSFPRNALASRLVRIGTALGCAACLGVAGCDAREEPASEAATGTSIAADTLASAADATANSGAAAAAGSDALKACDLITADELESILGSELEAGRTTNDYAGDSKCKWDLPGDAQRGVSIALRRLPDLSLYEKVPGSAPAAGLGDAAVWNATYGQLAVLEGERVISIALLVDEPQREHVERIARIGLAKL